MMYDPGVYTVPEKIAGCFVDLAKEADIRSLNELQLIKAGENIYFASPSDADRLVKELERASLLRPISWHRITRNVLKSETPHGKVFGPASSEAELADATEELVASHGVLPTPHAWVSKLRYRDPIRTFPAGGAGYVRKKGYDRHRGRPCCASYLFARLGHRTNRKGRESSFPDAFAPVANQSRVVDFCRCRQAGTSRNFIQICRINPTPNPLLCDAQSLVSGHVKRLICKNFRRAGG